MNVFDLVATIRVNLDEFDRGLNAASSKFKSFSDNLSKTGSSVKELLSPAVDGFKAVEGVGQKAADTVKKGLAGFAAAATAVGGFGASAVKAGMSFDSTMSEVSAISGATGEDFDALRDKALEMGAKTKFSASEAAAAMTYMGMAGWKTEDMLGGIAGIMNLAAASGEDLATTSDIVTNALTAFGMQADESAHFADIMATAASSANTDVHMMGESFKYAAPVMGTLGYSAEDTAVALGLMGNAGIQASMAGTSLKTAMLNMSSPTKAMAGVMSQYKISLKDANGEMYSLGEVMLQLRDKMGGLDETTKAAAASTLFGKEAAAGMLSIINAAPEDFEKLTVAIDNCNGSAERMSAIMMDNLAGDVQYFKSALESLQIAISDALTPTLREFAQFGQQAMANLLEGFQGGGVSGFMSALSDVVTDGVSMLADKAPAFAEVSFEFIEALAEGLLNSGDKILGSAQEIVEILQCGIIGMLEQHSGDFIEAGRKIIEFIGNAFLDSSDLIAGYIKNFVPLIAEGFLKYHEVLFSVGLDVLSAIGRGIIENKDKIQSMASEIIKNMVESLRTNAPNIIEGAIALLDALAGAIGENMPLILEVGGEIIGEIAKGISGSLPALLTVAGTIVPYIAKAIDVVTNIGKTIKSVVDLTSGGMNNVIDIGKKLTSGIQSLWGLILAHPVAAAVAAIIAAVVLLWNNCEEFRDFFINLWENLKESVSAFAEWFQQTWDGVKEFFSGLWESFKEIVSGFGEWLSEKIGEIVDWFKEKWDGVKEFFSELWEGLKEYVSAFGEWISEKMSEIVQWIKEKWDGISEFFSGVWESIKEVFQSVVEFFDEAFSAAAEAVQTAWNAVVEFFQGLWDGIQNVFSVAADVLGGFFSAAWEAIQAAWSGVAEFFTGVWEAIQSVFSTVVEVLGGFFSAAWDAVRTVWEAATEFFSGIADGIHSVFETVTQFLSETFQAAWDAVQAAWDVAIGFFSGIWDNIRESGSSAAQTVSDALKKAWEAIKSAWEGATDFFRGIFDKIVGVFDGIGDKFLSIGKNIVDGLKNGVTNAWDSFMGFISSKVGGIVDSVKGMLGIHSPSTVFAGIGENMALGLSEGWADQYSSVKSQIERGMNFGTANIGLTASGTYSAGASVQQLAGNPANGGNTFNFTFNSPKAMNPYDAAREAKKAAQQIALSYV